MAPLGWLLCRISAGYWGSGVPATGAQVCRLLCRHFAGYCATGLPVTVKYNRTAGYCGAGRSIIRGVGLSVTVAQVCRLLCRRSAGVRVASLCLALSQFCRAGANRADRCRLSCCSVSHHFGPYARYHVDSGQSRLAVAPGCCPAACQAWRDPVLSV